MYSCTCAHMAIVPHNLLHMVQEQGFDKQVKRVKDDTGEGSESIFRIIAQNATLCSVYSH